VKCARRCYEIDVKQGDPDNISSSLNTLAGIYMSMRQPREAEKYILKGIDYAKKTDNPQRMAVLHGMASEVYQHLGNHERSLYYATEAYEMEKALGRKDKMAIRQAERAPALIALERYDEAQKALNEAIPGLRESGNLHSLAIACNQMGLLMHRADNDSAAVRYYHEALDILIAQHDLYNESRSRQGLYEALRQTDPAKAMEHNDRYLELRDSLYDKDTGELLSKYAAEYGVGELKAENRQMQNYIIIGIVGLAVLVCLGSILVWWMRRRQKQRIAQLIKQIETLKPQPSVVEEQPNEVVEENNEDHKFLMKLVEVVNASLPTGHYGVEQIAQEMNMSVQTFRRRLLSATGESPKAFISALQMERAAKLLTDNPDMPISRVATLCGYDETNSFGRSFKRFYNLTPSQYRDKTA
jgi:AraC-like DNA-binding protein